MVDGEDAVGDEGVINLGVSLASDSWNDHFILIILLVFLLLLGGGGGGGGEAVPIADKVVSYNYFWWSIFGNLIAGEHRFALEMQLVSNTSNSLPVERAAEE